MYQVLRRYLSVFFLSRLLLVSALGPLPQESLASPPPPGLCRVSVRIETIERVSALVTADPVEKGADGAIRRIKVEFKKALVTVLESSSHDDGSSTISFLNCSGLKGRKIEVLVSSKISTPPKMGELFRGTLSLNHGEGLPTYSLE